MSVKVRWSWITLLGLALALRLAVLASAPLTPAEVSLALPAWDAARGAGWPVTTESPFLLVGNVLLFWLFGAGDGIARLWPALAGVALSALPLLWRQKLGEVGALMTGALLTVSPIALYAARTLDGASISVLAAGLLFTGLLRPSRDWTAPVLRATGLGLGLISGPVFYDTLLVGLLGWLAYRWGSRTSRWSVSALWGRVAAFGVLGALVLATGFGLRWSGWAGPIEPLLAWLAQWRGISGGVGLPLLVTYEPVTLFLAAAMLGWAVIIMDPWTLALGFASLLALLVLTLRPGAAPLALLSIVMPLALLGGELGQRLWMLRRNVTLISEGLHIPLCFFFWIFALLALARHTTFNTTGLELPLVILVIMIQLFLIGTFAMFVTRASAWRGALLGTTAFLFMLQLGFGWGVAFSRRTTPAEPLVRVAASADIRNLRTGITKLQQQRGISDDALEIVLIDAVPDLTPTLRWVLRDLLLLTIVDAWTPDLPAFVIAPEGIAPPTSASRVWQGAAFTTHLYLNGSLPGCTSFSPLRCRDPVRWYLYRELPTPPQSQRVMLWAAP